MLKGKKSTRELARRSENQDQILDSCRKILIELGYTVKRNEDIPVLLRRALTGQASPIELVAPQRAPSLVQPQTSRLAGIPDEEEPAHEVEGDEDLVPAMGRVPPPITDMRQAMSLAGQLGMAPQVATSVPARITQADPGDMAKAFEESLKARLAREAVSGVRHGPPGLRRPPGGGEVLPSGQPKGDKPTLAEQRQLLQQTTGRAAKPPPMGAPKPK